VESTSPRIRPAGRSARFAIVGTTTLALVALGGFGAWAAVSTDASTASAARDSQLSEAYGTARFAVVKLELAVREEQLVPTPRNQQRVIAAVAALRATLPAIARSGARRDRSVVANLRAQIDATAVGLARMRAASKDFDLVAANRLDRVQVAPHLQRIESTVDAAAASHREGLTAGLSSARRSQVVALGATLVMFVLGLLLTAAIVAVLRFKRRLDDARRTEIDRLRDAATRDSLTGLANHRAFHECLDRLVAAEAEFALGIVDLDGLKRTNDTYGHQAGDELLEALAHGLAAVAPSGHAYRIGGDEFAVIVEGGTAIDAFGIAQDLRQVIAGATTGIAERAPGEDKHALIRRADLALLAAKRTHREVLVYSVDMELVAGIDLPPDERHLSTLATALARAVDAKDSYTRSHCETVAELCVLIAGELGLDADRVSRIRLAGLLHDVGKIGISDAILQKPAPLTPDEAAVMRTHPDLGAHIVSAAELYEEAEWILHHHERLDGHGYPDNLIGDEVPIESRIIMVADAFEAMTSDRPYRPRRPVEEALAELDRHAGSQFDPACVAALQRVLRPVAPQRPTTPSLSAAA
jgi:diguanylate cyclase (GGDEF)-like protein/putative nucleotidyltransferase with HDIG domain